MDYTPKVSGAYWEISRELCFWQQSITASYKAIPGTISLNGKAQPHNFVHKGFKVMPTLAAKWTF
ncbi:MAG: hypothetical protein J6U59_04200 [Alistipes sp.]|nr:hypothetical protein [Alistipes sp.]